MLDLTTPKGVEEYLSQTQFAASSVVSVSGGISNFAYRIILREPYTVPGLDTPVKTIFMKHGEQYIAAWKDTKWKDIPANGDRQVIERLAFTSVPELVGPLSIVGLPTLYHEDRENLVMFMTDSGPDSRHLKSVFQSGPLPNDLARNIGADLGTFLARLHTSTQNPVPGTPAHIAKTKFAANHQARGVISKFYYGGILNIFAVEPPLLSPPLNLSPETITTIDAFAKKTGERVETSDDVLIMGDFWTGNILLNLDPTPRVMVVDWEGARLGFPGLDIGQFLAELHLLRVFHPDSRASVDILVTAFLKSYRTIILQDGSKNSEERLAQTARDSAGRMGAHLIVLTPQMPWGGPELTREVVQEGVEYILHSLDEDDAWLKDSIVGGLLD